MSQVKQNGCAADVQRILAAARFAAEHHSRQKRKGEAGEPYINHLIEVAELIANSSNVLDADLVMAGFLHDTVEDTNVTPQELEQRFGKEVASLVMEVTDDKSLPKEERKAIQVKDAHTKTPRAQTLKLADKISNLRALLSTPPANWSVQRKRDYFDWARDVVSRLTHPNPTLKAEFDRTYARIHEIEM
jgi:guanosine-3',5'-bis(diphosphate) 3'-pyrophosphohydrolase